MSPLMNVSWPAASSGSEMPLTTAAMITGRMPFNSFSTCIVIPLGLVLISGSASAPWRNGRIA